MVNINQAALETNFIRLKEAVLARRPVLGEILKINGKKSVFDFVSGYIAKKQKPLNIQRQKDLIAVVKEETTKRLGEAVANSVASAVYLEDNNPVLENVITLACANVSLNNFSFPRVFAFHSDVTGKSNYHRFSFLPSNSHSYPVYGFRGYHSDEIEKVKVCLKEALNKGNIRVGEAEKMMMILQEVYGCSDLLSEKYYSDQISKTNFQLWNKVIPAVNNKKINFVYLEQEWIVASLLIKHHLSEKTTISRILYDDTSEELLMKYFAGLPESFSRREHIGTYLFWAQPKIQKSPHRLRLWKEGNFLGSEDGSYKVELTPQALRLALESKELIPSVLLTFITLCFYYGLGCLGGLGQINYLPRLKEAYIKMQADLGHTESIQAIENIETKNLGGEITVAFISSKINGTAPATLFDFLLNYNQDIWPTAVAQMHQLTLEEAIVPMFPEDYPMTYPLAEREPDLLAVGPKEITTIMHLDQKIKPCVSM